MTGLASSGLASVQPSGGASSATPKRLSPAVVIAAWPPSAVGKRARQIVRAAMAAEQRDDARAVLGDRDDRRLVALVGKERREDADQDAGGADADDGRRP